jgi:hypothetical protein
MCSNRRSPSERSAGYFSKSGAVTTTQRLYPHRLHLVATLRVHLPTKPLAFARFGARRG